jgi:hypothetical protein
MFLPAFHTRAGAFLAGLKEVIQAGEFDDVKILIPGRGQPCFDRRKILRRHREIARVVQASTEMLDCLIDVQ